MKSYVHGYSNQEAKRLQDQADTLTELLHQGTSYPEGSSILEAGCGTGAQTVTLAVNSPGARFLSIDISQTSITKAKAAVEAKNITNVTFRQADIFNLPFKENSFDHIFVCFVLEHLPNPVEALKQLKTVLKPEGSITVIEGDHGSFYCHPASDQAALAVKCLIDIQAFLKGNSLVGRQLFPLLSEAGFKSPAVSPRMVYADASKPDLVEGFSKKTFIAMVEGVKEQALSMNLITETTWNKGIKDLYRATEKDGTFCYTFFKGTGINRK